jgi:hypothetical protein
MNIVWYDEYTYYIIFVICIIYLIIIATLKIKYKFWYSQPISLRVSPYWWWSNIYNSASSSTSSYLLSKQYNLSNTSTILPFIHNVNRKNIKVYHSYENNRLTEDKFSRTYTIETIPFTDIVDLINTARYNETGSLISEVSRDFVVSCVDYERFALTVNSHTHGLSPFVGVYYRRTYNNNNKNGIDISEMDTVEGVSILLPRQKIEYDIVGKNKNKNNRTTNPVITTIYVCDHYIWNDMLLTEDQSLELLETTEYFQKSLETAGEITLYRYSKIPWFIIPFTTVYTYGISLASLLYNENIHNKMNHYKYAHTGTILVKVTSLNFDIFYRFIDECSRDFRCSILNPISHIQHLVDTGLYNIYILVVNKTLVISAYIFGPSWVKSLETKNMNHKYQSKKRKIRTYSDRIHEIHTRISETSTALVKYLPPKKVNQYDLSGKRIRTIEERESLEHTTTSQVDIPRLMSSIRLKRACDLATFVAGFLDASRDLTKSLNINITSKKNTSLIVDTFAHNYMILDEINKLITPLWIDKWYYVMYNANIHTEVLCKDTLII